MRITTVTAALFVALLPGWGAATEITPLATPLTRAGFEKLDFRNGVTVYRHKQSRTLHFAAEANFIVPPARVQQGLLAYERQVAYIGRLSESRVLQRRPDTLVVYQRVRLPVIDDRDYTLQVRWGQTGAMRWVTFHALTSRALRSALQGGSPAARTLSSGPARRKGVVRVTRHSGSWQLRPIHGGRATFARYQMEMDLAGWVPMWLARRSAGKEVAHVFAEFSRMMADGDRGAAKTSGRHGSARPPGGADRTPAGSR